MAYCVVHNFDYLLYTPQSIFFLFEFACCFIIALHTNFKFGWFQNVWKNQIARPEMKLINKIYGRISGNSSGKSCLQSRNLPWGRTGQFPLRLYCCCYVRAIQRQRTQLFGFILMTERWLNAHNRSFNPWLAAALLREQNRQRFWNFWTSTNEGSH